MFVYLFVSWCLSVSWIRMDLEDWTSWIYSSWGKQRLWTYSTMPNIGGPWCWKQGREASRFGYLVDFSQQCPFKLIKTLQGPSVMTISGWPCVLPSLDWYTSSSLGLWVKQCPLALLNAAGRICRHNPSSPVQPLHWKITMLKRGSSLCKEDLPTNILHVWNI